jgi:predicted Zn-dependent protease
MGYQLLMSIVVGASGKQNILQATDIIFSLVNLGYSRQDEYLADKLGVKYTKRAGFNPYGAVTFFRKLQAEADKEGPQANIVFLSSHPPIYERIKRVEAEISNLGP